MSHEMISRTSMAPKVTPRAKPARALATAAIPAATRRPGVALTALASQVLAAPDGSGLNACVACCDIWAASGRIGLECHRRDGSRAERDFAAMRDDAARFANLLTARGIRPGDVVAALLPRGATLLTVMLGCWRVGAIYQPLSAELSPAGIEAHLHHTGMPAAKLVVTDVPNRGTLGLVAACPPILVDTAGAPSRCGDGDFTAEMMRQNSVFIPVGRDADAPFILLIGGAGGTRRPLLPKLGSLLTMRSSLLIGLDPGEAAVGWDVTDPAWSFLLYYPVLRRLLLGLAVAAFDTPAPAAPVSAWRIAVPASPPSRALQPAA